MSATVELQLVPGSVQDAECAVLSCIIQDQSLGAIADELRPEDFSNARRALIYAAAIALQECGTPIEPYTLQRELDRKGQLARAGGAEQIGDLIDVVPTTANVGEYVQIVLDAAKARAAQKHFAHLAELAGAGELKPEELADRAQRAADALRGLQTNARFQLLTDHAIEQLSPLEYMIEGAVPAGSLSALVAPPGSGKSFCALALCVSVATGADWLGNRVLLTGPAILIAAEGSSGIRQRLEASKHALGLAGQSIDVRFLLEPVNFFEPAEARAFAFALRRLPRPPALIVIDTLHRSMEGADENSARDMGRVIAGIDRVRKETGAAVLIVHHTNYTGEKERGSTSLRGAVDTLLQLRQDESQLQLTCEKQKDAAPFAAIGLELVPTAGSCVVRRVRLGGGSLTSSLTINQRKLLRSVSSLSSGTDGARQTLAFEDSKLAKPTFYRLVNQLASAGYLSETKRGQSTFLRLTDSGKNAAESQESQSVSPESQPSLSLKSHESHTPLGVRPLRHGETRPETGRAND